MFSSTFWVKFDIEKVDYKGWCVVSSKQYNFLFLFYLFLFFL